MSAGLIVGLPPWAGSLQPRTKQARKLPLWMRLCWWIMYRRKPSAIEGRFLSRYVPPRTDEDELSRQTSRVLEAIERRQRSATVSPPAPPRSPCFTRPEARIAPNITHFKGVAVENILYHPETMLFHVFLVTGGQARATRDDLAIYGSRVLIPCRVGTTMVRPETSAGIYFS